VRKRFNDMAVQPPSVPGGQTALGLAWTIPALLLVYIGIGFWVGGLLGSRIGGTLVGWVAGMAAVFYEIRKVLRNDAGPSRPTPSTSGKGTT
jgi:hypothetical protein